LKHHSFTEPSRTQPPAFDSILLNF